MTCEGGSPAREGRVVVMKLIVVPWVIVRTEPLNVGRRIETWGGRAPGRSRLNGHFRSSRVDCRQLTLSPVEHGHGHGAGWRL